MEAGPVNEAVPPFAQTRPFTVLSHTRIGSQEVSCDGVQTCAEVGEVFMVQSNRPMTIAHSPDAEGRFQAHWLHFYFTLFGTIDFVGFLDLPLKVSGAAAERLGQIIAELVDSPLLEESRFPYGFVRRRELAYEVLRILCELAPVRIDSLGFLSYSWRLVPVFRFIDEHMDERVKVADLADMANLSLSRFHVFFKERMGESPMEYIKRVRIERSRQFLATTDWPIYAVAEAVGFVSQFHFSRAFKVQVGMTPSVYRRQIWPGR
jgi:AraC family transcriptional regulator, arabinose operon regulatory protein